MAFLTWSILILNLAERNPSIFAKGFLFFTFWSVANSSLFEENKPAPEIKRLTRPIKNNLETTLIKRFIAISYFPYMD